MSEKKVSKFIKLLMAFAIFWMVIGDLITYHQQVIFGVNYFDTHNPFTKPKSKDDGKTISFNSHKAADKSDVGFSIFPPGILQENGQQHYLVSQRLIVREFIFQHKTQQLSLSGLLRAPPILS